MTGGGGLPLAGARVLITRTPERSVQLVSALQQAGAEALLLPLIDFERAPDQHSLDVGCDALAAGAFDWLVVTSATTVHVLKDKAAERGRTLGRWVPASTRVAAVGPACRQLLEAEGVQVSLTPAGSQSAAGLLAVWPAGGCKVFLPQADIAAPLLGDGLRAAGASLTTVTAYRTVDYPAHPERRLALERVEPASFAVLSPQSARAGMEAGRLDAVVAASPSAARRIHAVLSPLGNCRLVAIGRSTADAATALGLPVAAVAAEPTPAGLIAAVSEALEGSPDGPHQGRRPEQDSTATTPDIVKDR